MKLGLLIIFYSKVYLFVCFEVEEIGKKRVGTIYIYAN